MLPATFPDSDQEERGAEPSSKRPRRSRLPSSITSVSSGDENHPVRDMAEFLIQAFDKWVDQFRRDMETVLKAGTLREREYHAQDAETVAQLLEPVADDME
jgi:hypothetical protein